jgi:dienelactone hydrolase
MKKYLLMILPLMLGAVIMAQSNEGAIDSGKLLTFSDGKQIGTETFTIRQDGVREEYAASVKGLRAALVAAPQSAGIDYSAPPAAPFTAEEVTVNAKGFTLSGTLLLPKTGKRPFPAVITITGSGQQTRDEPIPIPGLEKYGLFRQVAETLASRGIAVLRVDDRGVGKSTGLETLQTATTSGFADDVRAEVSYLRSRSEIDPKRIALVGHSEGGIIAPMVAAGDSQIAAIALMAGSGKRGDQISMDQMNDVLERDTTMTAEEKNKKRAEQQEIIRAVQTGGDLSKYPAQVRIPWIKEFWTYDPLVTIRKVRQPVLILQGALDRQVTAEQAAMLEKAARDAGNKDVTTRVFPNLNHLFLPAKTGAFSEYSTLETNIVGDDVLKTLGDWLEVKLKVVKKTGKQ